MSWTRSGKISVTNGQVVVTGTGTNWITTAGAGEALQGPDGRYYEIANIASNTEMTLGSPYLGATQAAQDYAIMPSQSYIRDLAAQAAVLVNEFSDVVANLGTLAAQDASAVDVNGGTIDGTVIGGTTPAAGSFTTLSATGPVSASGSFSANQTATAGMDYQAANNSARYFSWGPVGTVGSHTWFSGAGGSPASQVATLDAVGNLMLGAGAPSAWYAVVKAVQVGDAGASLSAGTNALSSDKYYWMTNNGYVDNTFKWRYSASKGSAQYKQFNGIHTWHTAPSGTAGNPITFTQAMTLDASGNLFVNATELGQAKNHFAYSPGNAFGDFGHDNLVASGIAYTRFLYNGSAIGSITQSGTTAVTYNTTSDPRLKTNVRPANASRFNDIEFVDFEWIDGRHDCGVLAPQLQSIYPDLVIGEKDAVEIRAVEIEPAIPAVTAQVLVTGAIFNDDGEEIEPAVYETVEITPAVEAVMEDQTFPVYQQVNHIGLIGRMGTRIQIQDKQLTAQAELIAKMEAHLALLEARLALLEAA